MATAAVRAKARACAIPIADFQGELHAIQTTAGALCRAELAAPENRQDGDRVIIAGRDSLQDTVNQVGQEVTRRNLNIKPTLTSRPGLPVRIIVNRDLVLRPYQPLFFNKGTSR